MDKTITLNCFKCHNDIQSLDCPVCHANNQIPFNNRKLLIKEAIIRINNYMDDCLLADECIHLDYAKHDTIIEVIDDCLSAIAYRYNERAIYEPETKKIYDTNIKLIKQYKKEIKKLL